ncbi:MAG: glycosyltransferase family 2 protein [Gemmataceae bacterium]
MDVTTRAMARRFNGANSVVLGRPRLSVLLVNYRRWHDTARLVRQLRTACAMRDGVAEVVIVDNASRPAPPIARLRRTPHVSVVRWRENRGFAVAVNEAASRARGSYLLLLNPDMTASPDFLDEVLDRADALFRHHPDAGIVGYRLRHSDGSTQLSSGTFPTLAQVLTRLLLPRSIRKYRYPGPGVQPVDWVTGCCLMARRDCWEDLGGFDPAFFLYYEDVDLCRRARQRGWSVWHDPQVSIVHHMPLHRRRVPAHLRLVTRHALLTYAAKHWSPIESRLLARVIHTEALARATASWLGGDSVALQIFQELVHVTKDHLAGRIDQARARLLAVIREQERRYDLLVDDRCSQPQSARSLAHMPEQPHSVQSAGHSLVGRR